MGCPEGSLLGWPVGWLVGRGVGRAVGEGLGLAVGVGVGFVVVGLGALNTRILYKTWNKIWNLINNG